MMVDSRGRGGRSGPSGPARQPEASRNTSGRSARDPLRRPTLPLLFLALPLALVAGGCGADSDTTDPDVEEDIFRTVVGGATHGCALTVDGIGMCWGSNRSGQLGAIPPGFITPVEVRGGFRFTELSRGTGASHNCGLTVEGLIVCWGRNDFGQAGDPEGNQDCPFRTCRRNPTPVPFELDGPVRQIAAGGTHSCALMEDGTAYCWGNNERGQLGAGPGEDRHLPVPVSGNRRFVDISAGEEHTCALDIDGTAWCWGFNRWSTLGHGRDPEDLFDRSTDSDMPVQVVGDLRFISIVAGSRQTCALDAEGRAYCWGSNGLGNLGNLRTDMECVSPPSTGGVPEKDRSAEPVPVCGDLRFEALTSGWSHTCGLTAEGEAYCWGANGDGQVGNCEFSQAQREPAPVCGGLRFQAIGAGSNHVCAVTPTGVLYCWGSNSRGQLGSSIPTVAGPVRVTRPG